jgi:hypothetical protein
MSLASEIDAIAYDSMAKRCADQAVEIDVLRKRLDNAVRKIVALESVKESDPVRPVQWSPFPDGSISPSCARAIKEGWISEYHIRGWVANEDIAATNGQALTNTRDDMLRTLFKELLARVIVQTQEPERRTMGVVMTARVIVGKIDA